MFPLQNGQYWQQSTYAYVYHYAYAPAVRIVRDGSGYQLHVDGVDESIGVKLVDVVVDSTITSDFNGWDGDTTFEFANGQIWRQSAPGVATLIATRPRALIFGASLGYEMQVEGESNHVGVERIR